MARTKLVPIYEYKVGNSSEQIRDWVGSSYCTLAIDTPPSGSTKVTITDKYKAFPDLLSYKFYGTCDHWWILCLLNGVIDPLVDIAVGDVWVIPPLTWIKSLSTTNTSSGTIVEI